MVTLLLLVAFKVSYLSLEMASEPEPEPDFSSVANLGIFEKPDVVLEDNVFVNALQPETLDADVILGDTNTKVPGRIKGKLKAYLEADASKYVLDTIAEGYKLIFIDNVPPPLVAFQIINPLCVSALSFILNWSDLSSLAVLGKCFLGPTSLIRVASSIQRN